MKNKSSNDVICFSQQLKIIDMKYSVTLFLFLVLGCDPTEDGNKTKLIKVDEITFPVSGFASVNPALIQLVESDSGDYLFLYNHVAKNFQYVEFPTGKLIHEVLLRFEGPNNVQGFTGGTLIDQDSIWITFYPPAIGLINFDGDVLLKKRVGNDLFHITTLGATSHRALTKNGKRIFGPQPYFMNHHGMGKEDIRKHQLVYSYDSESDSVQWYDVFYADNYWDQGKKMSEFSWDEREGRLYIAPFYDHEIQVFDMNTGKIVLKKEVISSYINHFDYVNEMPTGMNEAIKNNLEYDRYGTLIYDKYREVFYRIFIPGFEPQEDIPIEDLTLLNRFRSKWGIMILDKDLNLMGEHIFDDFEAYSAANFFVGKKGLYLSMNNLFHPDYEEDRFRYMLMELAP